MRPPYIRPSATSSLFSTLAHLGFPDVFKDIEIPLEGTEEAESQRDDADEPNETTPVRRPEIVGQSEEARELREWLSEAPKRERKEDKGTKYLKSEEENLEEELERSKLAKSVLVKPARMYPSKRESRKSWRTHYQSVSSQVYLDRNFQNLLQGDLDIPINPLSTDWRDALSVLTTRTLMESDEWLEDGMKIELPRHKFDAIMQNGGDEKIGAIRRRTGASIKVSSADTPTDAPSLLVSGTRAAINSTIAEFRRIAGRITVTRLWADLRPGEARTESFSEGDFFVPPLTREEGGLWQRSKIDYNAYTTPWPTHISFRSFERYVASLIDSVMLPHLNSVLYNPTKHAVLLDHERAVARRLQRAFTNREAKPWISCSALKLALSFLCRSGDKFLPEARAIYDSMDRFGLRMDADVFNMLLKAPTATRHLRKFRRTVIDMSRKGLAPNLDTWILFLRMFESVEVKSYILQAMHSKNLLGTPEAIRRIAEEMARFDAEHAMSQGKDLSKFLQEQDERYGADWLTRDAVNPVLDVVCRYGRFHDAFSLLDRMRAYVESIPPGFDDEADRIPYCPDVVSFNTIISHARTQGKISVAVNAARKMKAAVRGAQADRATFDMLFDLAWRSRLRATVSVVWKYASLARLTTWRMRQRVAGLIRGPQLQQQIPNSKSNRNSGKGNKPETVHDVSTSTYAQLGGEDLARDLVGGDRAIARIRSLAHGRHPSELGTLATKCWPEAFSEFGPTLSLGYVLSQAVLRDLACLGAKKKKMKTDGTSGDGGGDVIPPWVAEARVNVLPLRARTPGKEVGLGDLAPLEDDRMNPIGAADKWVLDDVLVGSGEDGEDVFGAETTPHEEGQARSVQSARMAILDPGVWDDLRGDGGDEGTERGETTSRPTRHELQIRNEDDILAGLDKLEREYFMSFRKVVNVDDDVDGVGWPAAYGLDESDWRRIISSGDAQVGGGGDDGAGDGRGAEREVGDARDDGGRGGTE